MAAWKLLHAGHTVHGDARRARRTVAIRAAIEAEQPETRYSAGWLAEKNLAVDRTLSDREIEALATRPIN
ncbi:hypothetical protein [Actinomadura mexicana]|uniref:Uncharacterized protein n=1 Tax=Actinomadura mexicana TaxID=134959 RepID=A0A238X835_9ACTN|nr:hypothetical protein [Actinomadura mexicana]SNR55097.1 hypothetical protein SAMN06265355_10467 [Actinomadura mexicana]